MTQASAMENPLWDYTLSVYARTRVKGLSLELNRRYGMDCNLLLLAAFAGVHGRSLSLQNWVLAREKVADFHDAYMQKLAALKKKIADDPAMTPEVEKAWADLLLKTELQAEQVEQSLLWQHLSRVPLASADPQLSIEQNLCAYAAMLGQEDNGDLMVRLRSLAEEFRTAPPGGGAGPR